MTENLVALLRGIGSTPGAQEGQLTLPELGALIYVAGREHGFEVHLEVQCCAQHPRHKVDCVWRAPRGNARPGRVIVAWEFDGRDASRAHLLGGGRRRGNVGKLGDTGAPMKIQALYSWRNRVLQDCREATQDEFRAAGIEVYLDADLIRDIEGIANRARTHL